MEDKPSASKCVNIADFRQQMLDWRREMLDWQRDRIAELEAELKERDATIADLEHQLDIPANPRGK